MPLNMPIIEWLTGYAATKGATPSQIALAWLMANRRAMEALIRHQHTRPQGGNNFRFAPS
ncbi:aryl-alcohol dehydrogenase-like predicted oxidoreductase [Mycoplana sp. BE70]|nr:aryl-alcohol dehydrogenase-like predicted oxidoreductase [Mycoplana sp. BE70]